MLENTEGAKKMKIAEFMELSDERQVILRKDVTMRHAAILMTLEKAVKRAVAEGDEVDLMLLNMCFVHIMAGQPIL